MARYKEYAGESVHELCFIHNLDEKLTYDRARMLLSAYRQMCFSRSLDGNNSQEELVGRDPRKAIQFLESFDPKTDRQDFLCTLRDQVEKNWIIDMVDTSMMRLREYEDQGRRYFDIVNRTYMVKLRYSESEMLEDLQCERTCYYVRKKEAVTLFGVCFWGSVLPEMKASLGL
ncbi:MAG TPA: hypothetical protein DEO39_02710 [Clostridiales bacterium]|nr:hypothetical protein [Clostridiales bacterium]